MDATSLWMTTEEGKVPTQYPCQDDEWTDGGNHSSSRTLTGMPARNDGGSIRFRFRLTFLLICAEARDNAHFKNVMQRIACWRATSSYCFMAKPSENGRLPL